VPAVFTVKPKVNSMLHKINRPVVAIKATGNIRDKAKEWNYTYFAYYDAIERKTNIFFKAPMMPRREVRSFKRQINDYLKRKRVQAISIDYHINGVDIMQMAHQN
jgi:hypothetical protein